MTLTASSYRFTADHAERLAQPDLFGERMSRMIVNRYRGRCACGTVVQAGNGYVNDRKITCIQCAPMDAPTGGSGIAVGQNAAVSYQGCDDHESMSEWHYDNFGGESDFLGFDVGDL